MINNGKKPLKPGKTPSNYHLEIHCKIESAFDNLDLFTKQPDNVVSFKADHPPSYPVDDCDNDTTIPYVEDQSFFQSLPIHSTKNHFLSSWTGQPTLPSSITPLRPSIVHRPSIPSTFAKRPASITNRLQTPQHFSSLYPTVAMNGLRADLKTIVMTKEPKNIEEFRHAANLAEKAIDSNVNSVNSMNQTVLNEIHSLKEHIQSINVNSTVPDTTQHQSF
ncbi:Hypothetical predicted protein [Mytilus galloprovincialis]|uniref:Uncharacterized protein n=1 Tax=Mytilus galloprovincialis TaxID=29158 RepID=A0A8B6BQK7_MYTGA|nr:Hypothetical predicted protein [Mytilus galloprovincialis]